MDHTGDKKTEIEEEKKDTPRTRWINFLNMHHLEEIEFFNMLRDKKIVYDFDQWRCSALFKSLGQDFEMVFGNLLCERLVCKDHGASCCEDLSDGSMPRFHEGMELDCIVFLFLKMWFSDGEYFKVNKQKMKEYLDDRKGLSTYWAEFMNEAKEFVERYRNSVFRRRY